MTAPTIRIVGGPGSEDGPALVAAGIPVTPPRSWFEKRDVPDGTPLTFTTDGQVYGLLAPNDIDHIGMPGQRVRRPKSPSNYAYFHTGQVRCDDGTVVNTGRITMATGHAPTKGISADAAAAHYDNTSTRVADVVAWDSPSGTMCAGAATPGLTAEEMRMAMASPPSGDWRWINGAHDMVAALLVNTAGFPVPRREEFALAASGAPEPELALIAGGAPMPRIIMTTTTEDPMPETTETTEVQATTASAEPEVPSFDKDAVVRIPDSATLGLVASVEDGRAIVQVEVPVTDLKDAGEEGRLQLSASAHKRLMDSELKATRDELKTLREEMAAMVASAQAQTRGAQALNTLNVIPE